MALRRRTPDNFFAEPRIVSAAEPSSAQRSERPESGSQTAHIHTGITGTRRAGLLEAVRRILGFF